MMRQILDKVNCSLYADDTSLYCSGKELQKLFKTVEKEITVLKKNGLTIISFL